MDAAQEVKSRLNIEDVIAQYVQLKRMGRNYKGLSPWTNEKTASFVVSPEKQIWHDFSSGRGGDVISFVMEVEGLDFRGALEQLARQAGVDLEKFGNKPSSENTARKKRILEALDLAAKFYQKQLTGNHEVLEYLFKSREFTKDTILTWRLGYAPNNGRALVDFLIKNKFSTEDIAGAGLSTKRRSGTGDMFRGRVMVPLCDGQGSVIGFTARQLQEDTDGPKYINTPQTIVYDKSRHVFGLHLAKESIRKTGYVVACEGNLDVLQSWQVGVANVVASAGTAMTVQHLKELKRFTGDVRLSFDADKAGIAATERVIPLAGSVGVELRIISLPEGKDPDDLAREDANAWRSVIESAKEAPQWLLDQYRTQLDLSSASGKKTLTDKLLPTIATLVDPVEKEHYLKLLAEASDTSLGALQDKLSGKESAAASTRMKQVKQPVVVDEAGERDYRRLQNHLLAMILMQPSLRGVTESIDGEIIQGHEQEVVFHFLKVNPSFKPDAKGLAKLKEAADYVKMLSLLFEEEYASLSAQDLREQASVLKNRLIANYVKMQNTKLSVAMHGATNQKEINKLASKADALNRLINNPPPAI